VAFGADVQVVVPVSPEPPPPVVWSDSLFAEPPSVPTPPPQEAITREVVLAPVPALEVTRRGFFAGDATRLVLTLVDRASGAPLWVKTVESKDDPRDVHAVRALLERALDDRSGWVPAATAP
jgi:hypothetical protein